MPKLTEIETARFWAKVDVRDPGECWNWTAARKENGYGAVNYRSRTYYAHRVAFEIRTGTDPKGLVIRHTCDNRRCVNPDHLIPGTQADNIRDMLNRGRHLIGNRHQNAVLTNEQVAEMRRAARAGRRIVRIAEEANLNYATVHQAIRGYGGRWNHLNEPPVPARTSKREETSA